MYKAGIKYKTNKLTHHGYERFYDHFLIPLRYKNINVLEIGVDDLRSLKMWLDFFPNAKIYGVDINDKNYKYERGEIFKANQSKKTDLKKIVKKIGKCGFIIDDGSHVPEHQLKTFNYLFNECLDYGGVYIIEDVETSYWKKSELYGYNINAGYKAENNIVEIFKNILDIVNREFLNDENKALLEKNSAIDIINLKYISMISFGANCIIVKKMTEYEYKKYGEKKYRFENKL
jgi:hypothetical protein